MNTKKPSAIVYGLPEQGEFTLFSQVYWEEGLYDEVKVYSLAYNDSVFEDYTQYKPDLIISFGQNVRIPDYHLTRFHIHYDEILPEVILANVIAPSAMLGFG